MSGGKISILVSLQTKIIFITLLIITLVLGVFAVYEINRRQEVLKNELGELARVTGIKLKNNLRVPLWDLDVELVADTLQSEMLTRDISAILIFDGDGKDLLAGKQRDSKWNIIDVTGTYTPPDKSELTREEWVENRKERIGKVVVYVDDQFNREELSSSIMGLLITLLALDVIILLVLWAVMHNMVRRPMEELSEATNQLSRGNFDVYIDVSRKDEIGVVANSIDRMKISLRMAIGRLRELEKKRHQMRASAAGGRNA